MKRLEKPQAILFDFDDTLVNSKPIINAALDSTFDTYNIDKTELKNIDYNRSLKDYFHQIFENNLNEARSTYYNFYHHYSKNLQAFENAEEVLKFLKNKNIFVGVVSNKKNKILNHEISNYFNWNHYFSSIVGSGDASEDKPSIKPVELALKSSKITSAERVWLIGDSLVDLNTAKNFGCKAILYGEYNFIADPAPSLEVKNHLELLKILKEIYE